MRADPVSPSPAPATQIPGREALLADLRDRAFAARPGPDRVGVEVELIPVYADSGRVVPVREGCGDSPAPALLDFLGAHGGTRGWRFVTSTSGVPGFSLPGGGVLTVEPGGQVEYSSPAFTRVDALVQRLDEVVFPLLRAGAEAGLAFVTRGLDPVNPLAGAALQLDGERYTRMAAHYDRRGPWGRRMMRQSAAVHVNVDLGDAPGERWTVANRAVPVWTAAFANSPRAEGRLTGHRSTRAAQWRRLDPGRTGVVADGDAPWERYLDFAVAADAFLLGPPGIPARPLHAWLRGGALHPGAWRRHLSTLFPEVRPRGYLELRSFDALHPRWYAAPVVLTVGLLYDPTARRAAAELLPPPTPECLERAGREGLGDPGLARLVRDAAALALEGAARLGPVVGGRSLEVARTFVDELTRRGLDPGHREGDRA